MKQLKGLNLIKYKESLPPFNQTQKNIIIGTLLGDSCLYSNARKSNRPLYYLKFDYKSNSKSYVDGIYQEFKLFCGTAPKYYVKQDGVVKSYFLKTYGLKNFQFFADNFYKVENYKRRKVVPKLIHRWLNPESLSYWFMDDGSKDKSGYYLNTQSFSLIENKRLAKALGYKFKLQVNIHKDSKPKARKTYYRLYIRAGSRNVFTEIVSPFIYECFKYKLHE